MFCLFLFISATFCTFEIFFRFLTIPKNSIQANPEHKNTDLPRTLQIVLSHHCQHTEQKITKLDLICEHFVVGTIC